MSKNQFPVFLLRNNSKLPGKSKKITQKKNFTQIFEIFTQK